MAAKKTGVYTVEQYELHLRTWSVEATSAAEAVKLIQAGDGTAEDMEYVEVPAGYGVSGIRNIVLPNGDLIEGAELKNKLEEL